MEIEFSDNGKLSFLMKDHMKESIGLFNEGLDEPVSSLENKGLQNKNHYSLRLSRQDSDTLNYVIAKILWVAKRGRSYIDPAILFLCTRVTKITMECTFFL